jgi:nitrogen-specific signal transduction histidine kinase
MAYPVPLQVGQANSLAIANGGESLSRRLCPDMQQDTLKELRNEIHSPLAALRNALYLISVRCDDFQLLEYVKMAEKEALEISNALQRASDVGKVKAA